jgi:hypothetical protein
MRERIRNHVRHGYRWYLLGALGILLVAALSGAVAGLFAARFADRPDERRASEPAGMETGSSASATAEDQPAARYIEVVESCAPDYEDLCINVRSGPGLAYPAVAQLRRGVVLKVGGVYRDEGGRTWYRIVFDEWIRYPDRISKDWYVASDFVRPFEDESAGELQKGAALQTDKRIVIDRSAQRLFAYEGDELFMNTAISTGLDLTPTPRGTFRIYRKTPTRYMQGPLPGVSDQYYDLPGVPWNLYFTNEGGAIHGAFWHINFGKPWSHGCVNLPPEKARTLYYWADLGTPVVVRD